MALVKQTTPSPIRVIGTLADARQIIRGWKANEESIVFVPTMGNLHAGHFELVEAARKLGSKIVVSVFVNPLQFGKNEDFDHYPRTLEQDVEKLKPYNIDFVFAPRVTDMYPHGEDIMTRIDVPRLSGILEGECRPGFFEGVATVVNKLFNILQPDVSVFGEKDYQQLLLIRQMVDDLAMPIDIRSVPTVRESDGLAMSSRNSYLSREQRAIASELYSSLRQVVKSIQAGEDPYIEVGRATNDLIDKGFIVDYVVVRRRQDLAVPTIDDKQLIALAAVRLDQVRLIDNILFDLAL